jgi:hypothetical protein
VWGQWRCELVVVASDVCCRGKCMTPKGLQGLFLFYHSNLFLSIFILLDKCYYSMGMIGIVGVWWQLARQSYFLTLFVFDSSKPQHSIGMM